MTVSLQIKPTISMTNSTTATNQTSPDTSTHDEALSVVSYIGCGISIICLLATIIIIVLFRLDFIFANPILVMIAICDWICET